MANQSNDPKAVKPSDGPLPSQAELNEKLTQARIVATVLWPFIAPALMRLVPRWLPDGEFGPGTMGVDNKWRLYLWPRFVAKAPANQLALLIVAHELQHLLGGHGVRMSQYADVILSVGGSPLSLRNAAGDYAINDLLSEWIESANEWRRFVKRAEVPIPMPEKILFPEETKDAKGKPFPRREAAEVYADLLYELAKKNGDGMSTSDMPGHAACKCGTGAGMKPSDAPWEDKSPVDPNNSETGVTPEEADTIGRAVAEKVAEQVKKNQGSVPGGMRRFAEVLLAPSRVPWQQVVRQLVRTGYNVVAGQQYRSYTRAHRRTAGRCGVLFPGSFSVRPSLLVVLDTSGSMGRKDYAAAFSEIHAVLNRNLTGDNTVPVMCCDAATSPVQNVRRIQDVQMVGGGGTDMTLGIMIAAETRVGKARRRPALIVVMTDGFTGWPSHPPRGTKVIAVLTNRGCQPPPEWIQHCYACD